MIPSYLRNTREGVCLALLVQPRASREELAGEMEGRLKIRLTAPPVEGKANKALVRFLAKRLGVAASRVEITQGLGSRRKEVLVTGLEAGEVRARLDC